MAARRSKPSSDGIYEPNMTPLIDVSLVLVVILMVATPLAFQSGIAVQGAAKSGKAVEAARVERIELHVLAGGRVRVNRENVSRDSLGVVLQPLIASSPTGVVVVQCDDGVAHGEFVSVLDEARHQGAARIAVVGS